MNIHFLHRRFGLVLILAGLATGCDPGDTQTGESGRTGAAGARSGSGAGGASATTGAAQNSSPPRTADLASLSPAEVMTRLHDAHLRRDYETISTLITADEREAIMALLRSLDGVLDANDRVGRAASRRYAGVSQNPWSLGFMENNLGVFSRDIRVINQTIRGETALVNLQEGDNVPIVRAKLVRADGCWRYSPELPPKSMNRELDRLASLLAEIEGSLDRGLDMDTYIDAFWVRVLPQMEKVAMAKDATPIGIDETQITATEGE